MVGTWHVNPSINCLIKTYVHYICAYVLEVYVIDGVLTAKIRIWSKYQVLIQWIEIMYKMIAMYISALAYMGQQANTHLQFIFELTWKSKNML